MPRKREKKQGVPFFALIATVLLIALFNIRMAFPPCFQSNNISLVEPGGCPWPQLTAAVKLPQPKSEEFVIVDLPMRLIDWQWTSPLEVDRQAVLNLPIFNRREAGSSSRFDSSTVISIRLNENEAGLQTKAAEFASSSRHKKVGEVGSYTIYEQIPTHVSWQYFVPRDQPQYHYYLQCVRNCALYSAYRNVYYKLHIPAAWIESAPEVQALFHQFLDLVVRP